MIKTKYAGNMKIDTEVGGFKVRTDQPDGDNTAPNPFQLFLASFAACTAVFALFYLDKYGISREGVSVDLDPVFNKEGLVSSAKIIVTVPHNFPAEREGGLKHTVEYCKVGKHLNFPHEVVLVRK
ncbi:MAG: OsmC family protein [Elusimicrobium sp.]|jgi:ribosomal protein S12 methylthiotransferase accessory factor|nr:OsmC family protein [Elusimicrobium sp.]